MPTVSFEVPDDLLVALKSMPGEAAAVVRLAAAAKLYELGRLSSGAAARLADLPRVVFLQRLADFGVAALVGTAEELIESLETEHDEGVDRAWAAEIEHRLGELDFGIEAVPWETIRARLFRRLDGS